MRIFALKTIKDYIDNHADSTVVLMEWYKKTTSVNWKTFCDIKKNIASADYIGNDRYVFNIKGNKYRLVAIVIFASQKVYVRFIGTHSEYNKKDCSII